MNFEEEIDRVVKEMPPGAELFLPIDVAEAMFGIGKPARDILDAISRRNGCDIGYRQTFNSGPSHEGFRIMKPRL